MGQLERYGLYVLCLVIFLILGIAIWGDSPGPANPNETTGRSLTVTSSTGPEDTISEERRKQLEAEANFNEVVKIMEAASEPLRQPVREPVREPEAARLPLQKADRNKMAAAGASGAADTDASRTPPSVQDPKQDVRIHVVGQHETLEEISLRYLGKRHLWREILALNPGVRPTALQPGTKLKIPPREADKARAGTPPGTVTVRRGDNPGLISQRLFGTTKYADEIMRLNDIEDPRGLQVGAVLKVPEIDPEKAKAKAKTAAATKATKKAR